MIEESTQPGRIVTADLKRITFLMASIAFSLHSCNGGHHSVSYPWIFCHFHLSPFTPLESPAACSGDENYSFFSEHGV
jgi:hypothetical protein